MIAIISGKILNAWKVNPNVWLFKLKQYLSSFGLPQLHWEIFGGNAFLLKVEQVQESLWTAICIKAIFRQVQGLDVSITIGLGTEDKPMQSLRENEGPAYTYSRWKTEDGMPRLADFKIYSPLPLFDRQFNLFLDFALVNMNSWSTVEAEIVELCIVFPEKSQQEIADWLQIKQSAVSQRKKRAHFELLQQLNQHFKTELDTLLLADGSL